MATTRTNQTAEILRPISIARIVLVVMAVVGALAIVWLLRTPLLWLLLAGLTALALSAPVSFLSRYMKRGLAIAATYLVVLLVPIVIFSLVLPPLINQTVDFVNNIPQYADDTTKFIQNDKNLQGLQNDFQLGDKLQESARSLTSRLDDAANILKDIGVGAANSIFALVTILILAAFMLSNGERWSASLIARQPAERRPAIRRAARRIATSVSNYVGGVLMIAVVAGVTTFILLSILGVPFAGPLAITVALLDLIPMIGATLGAVVVAIVTLFTDFPTATIIWVIWAIIYQQVENTLVQPQIQRRAVDLHPFTVIVAVLFGSTLLGVLGALIAIPLTASLSIAYQEYRTLRSDGRVPTAKAPAAKRPPRLRRGRRAERA